MKSNIHFFYTTFVLFFALCLQNSVAQVPKLINYQAQIVSPVTHNPVTDGVYDITFSIYDVPAGGSPLWSETQSIQITGGIYNTLLGSIVPFTGAVFAGSERYLAISIGSGDELTPRKQIVSAAYALISEDALKLGGRDPDFYADTAHSHNNFSIDYEFLANTPQNLSDFNNDAGFITGETDSSVTNEIQLLSISNDTVFLTNGGFVKLPASFNGNYNDLTNKPTAGSGISIDASNSISETRYSIGQVTQGGIVFWLDETGEHGLVAATADMGMFTWANNSVIRFTCTYGGTGIGAGEMNTALIVALQYNDYPSNSPTFAASACAYYSTAMNGTYYGDWYLPSSYELQLMYNNLYRSGLGNFVPGPYWSSSEYQGSNSLAFMFHFGGGSEQPNDKRNGFYVRPIRRF